MSMQEYVNDFNNMACDLCENIATICPNSVVGRNKRDIIKAIKSSNTKIIDIFVLNVLEHKEEIFKGNDSYFLNRKYDEVESEHMNHIFEFKDYWKKISKQDRDVIIDYMKILCLLAQNYYEEIAKSL